MRKSNWTPSIVPNEDDQTVYLVADDFGRIGRAWREADYETTDLETVIQDLLTGQYSNPIRVVAFNTAERWSEDVSEDVAHELRRRCDLQMRDVPFCLFRISSTARGPISRYAAAAAHAPGLTWRSSARSRRRSASRRPSPASSSRRWRRRSRRCRPASAGSTRSSSTATASRCTSPTRPSRSSPAAATTGPSASEDRRRRLARSTPAPRSSTARSWCPPPTAPPIFPCCRTS